MSKYNIRDSIFETNSSSMHTVTMGDEDPEVSVIRLKNNKTFFKIDLSLDGYGRMENRRLKTPLNKLRYLFSSLWDHYDRELDKNEVEKKIIDTIKEEAGVLIEPTNRDQSWIDHASQDLLNYLFYEEDEKEFKNKLVKLVFDDNTIIEVE